jgi:hypothetical protein
MRRTTILVMLLGVFAAGCAGLTQLAQFVQAPRFAQAGNQPAELRFITPSRSMPAGGAGVRIWVEVTNPNPFGFTLSTVNASLALDGTHAASGDFPLGLPLTAGQQSVVPLDLAISFADLPGLAGVLRQMAIGGEVGYELEGTVGVDAGRLGTPTFGPMLLTRGDLRIVR